MATCVDGEQKSGMERVRGMNDDARRILTAEPMSETLLQVPWWRGAMIGEVILELGDSYSKHWSKEPSKRSTTMAEKTWEQACAAQQMMPQRSPFQADQAGSGVVVYGPLLRRQTPYPRFVVTTGAQVVQRPPPTNGELSRNEGVDTIEDRGSCARAREAQADGGE